MGRPKASENHPVAPEDASPTEPPAQTASGRQRRRGRAAPIPRAQSAAALAPERLAPAEVIAGCSAALRRVDGLHAASIGVTSCQRGEGRSVVAGGVAAVQRFGYGRKTVLVELDLAKPSLAGRMGLSGRPGVAELIRGEARLDQCLEWLDDDLAVLVAGDARGAGLSRAQAADLMAELRFACEVAVLDLPPLSTDLSSDALAVCSKVLLVVRAHRTPMPMVRDAVAAMAEAPAIVLNGTSSKVPRWVHTMFGG